MFGVVQDIATYVAFAIIAFGAGFFMRLSWEARLVIGIIVGFMVFGIVLSQYMFHQDVVLPKHLSDFISISLIITPLAYIFAPLISDAALKASEDVFAKDEFNETYKAYAKKHRTNHYTDFTWFDSADYHEWNQARYKKAYAESGGPNQSSPDFKQVNHNDAPVKVQMLAALGLSGGEHSAKKIKSAYRKLARKYHPDIIASKNISDAEKDKAAKKMQEINAAYEWLEDNGIA